MFDTLGFIGEKLNASGVVWAVGGSILLNHYGLVCDPNDIDIIIDDSCAVLAEAVLETIGKEIPPAQTQTFVTRHYHRYDVNGFDVDVMSGLAIKHANGIFRYIFNRDSVTGCMTVRGVIIPLSSLEDWYVIYQLIPGREAKAGLAEACLRTNGIKRADLLNSMLTQNLPYDVKGNIRRLLDCR